jgi:DNA-nicking Smr family endonuclease
MTADRPSKAGQRPPGALRGELLRALGHSRPNATRAESDAGVAADDALLFRQAVGPVNRIESDRITWHALAPPPIPAQRSLDDAQVLRELLAIDPALAELETGEELWYRRAGLQQGLLRKLRRGQFSVQGEIDLHGMTVPVARAALAGFLGDSLRDGVRCVRIVHGKGRGSPGRRPVLKGVVERWLQQREEVLAFCSARPADGGTGAVYVLLGRR